MAEGVRRVSPADIAANPENPRIIFREKELRELQDSIQTQGILVPLTVYETKNQKQLIILDGERRWRCARRLGLSLVPVIVQPEPSKMQNIMMMFAIHNARAEWEPLPTAKKLQQLEAIYTEVEGKAPNESELAQLASMSRGEVRRLKNVLALPEKYLDELMTEAEKPKPEQSLTVDHVLEATRAVSALAKRGIVDQGSESALTDAIVEKYRSGVIKNTVDARKLARIARAVERDELTESQAAKATARLISDADYSIDDAFRDSVEQIDFEHGIEQQVRRLIEKLDEGFISGEEVGDRLRHSLEELKEHVGRLLGLDDEG